MGTFFSSGQAYLLQRPIQQQRRKRVAEAPGMNFPS
jgi:hypothetical protein